MTSALLRGRAHTTLGDVGAVAQGPCAIALSRGGARKLYAHQEPNEDAVLFALGERGALVAVADGHHGADGSEVALEWLLAHAAPDWLGSSTLTTSEDQWRRDVVGSFMQIDRAITAKARSSGLMAAPTTLSLAIARPAEGHTWHASVGDSHVFEVIPVAGGRSMVRDHSAGMLRPQEIGYLGDGFESEKALEKCTETGLSSMAGIRALALATDGLSERGIGVIDPSEEVARLADAEVSDELRALTLARGLVDVALDAQRQQGSGDNVGTAVLWIEAATRPETSARFRD